MGVGCNPRPIPGATETLAADLTDKDQTIRAVAGSSVVHLLVGLQYDRKIWREMWPRVMSNTVEACKRAADFYGPGTRNGVPNLLVFEPLSRKRKASWLVDDSVPHSYTYTPDAAQSLVQLAESPTAWNQTWHVPTTANSPASSASQAPPMPAASEPPPPPLSLNVVDALTLAKWRF